MENGCILVVIAVLFGSGGVLISNFLTKDFTNKTVKNAIKEDKTDNSVDIGSMRQDLQQCKASMTQMVQDFISLQDNFTQIQEKVGNLSKVLNVSIKNTRDDFLHLKRDMKILNGMQDIQDHRYITYSESVFFLLVGLILEALILFLIAYTFFPWRNGFYGSQGSNHDDPHDTHESLCAQVPVQAEEEVEIKPFILEKTDPDVKDIPRCQFIFVFVDFNETNVILENPGDKRLVTVQACMKMRADVFVIYTRDRDSSHLGDGTLYNKDLSAFTGHFLLKELTAKNRGLSVNDTFTQYQKSHIRKIVLEK